MSEYPGKSVQTIAVGKWLRGVRGSRTREQFEELTGLSASAIEKWESGKRRMRSDILSRILDHCTPEQRAACPALRLGETEPPPVKHAAPPAQWSASARVLAEELDRLPEEQRSAAMVAALAEIKKKAPPHPHNVVPLKKRT